MAKQIRITQKDIEKVVDEEIQKLSERTKRKYRVGYRLLEALNLGRIEKHGANGFVILSGNRSSVESSNENNDMTQEYMGWCRNNKLQPNEKSEFEFLKWRNAEADRKLLEEIRMKGYTYSLTYGGYHGSDNVSDSFEPSVVVYNHKKNGEASDWNELFEFAIKMCGMFKQDSTTKRDKTNPQRFMADIVFEGRYYKPELSHEYVDRIRRAQYGEIFLG